MYRWWMGVNEPVCVCEEMDGRFELIDIECFFSASVTSPHTNTRARARAQTHMHTAADEMGHVDIRQALVPTHSWGSQRIKVDLTDSWFQCSILTLYGPYIVSDTMLWTTLERALWHTLQWVIVMTVIGRGVSAAWYEAETCWVSFLYFNCLM